MAPDDYKVWTKPNYMLWQLSVKKMLQKYYGCVITFPWQWKVQ